MTYFESMCKDNEMMGKMLQQILLGKVYATSKFIDTGGIQTTTKLSMFMSDVSSTGKDQGIKALERAVSEINKRNFLPIRKDRKESIAFDKSVDVNDSSLVGGSRKKQGELIEIRGKFWYYDIMCFPECSTLFVDSEYKTTMLQTLQEAMDYPGFVSKSLNGIEIKYNTETSLVLASIPFNKMSSYLINTGFFQRMMVYIGDKDFVDINEISEKIGHDIINNNFTGEEEKELMSFIDKLEESWHTKPSTISFEKECNEKLDEWNEMFCKYRDMNSDIDIKNKFASFQPRSTKNLLRMSANWSIFNQHKQVKPEDFDEPMEIMQTTLEGIAKLTKKIERYPKREENYDMEKLKEIIKNNMNEKKMEIYSKIIKELGVSPVTAMKLYKEYSR
jgi:hypothetical protein